MRHMIRYLLPALLILTSCIKDFPEIQDYTLSSQESEGILAGLYVDAGVWMEGVDAIEGMLGEMNCRHVRLNADSIRSGSLDHYTLLFIPGGDMYRYGESLGSAGVSRIREFVEQGGGYLGICGGAYFAARQITWRGWAGEPRRTVLMTGLGLLDGNSEGPIEDFAPAYSEQECRVVMEDNGHPISDNLPRVIEFRYEHGPKFIPDEGATYSLIGRTEAGEHPVILACPCHSGRVFVSGLHAEFDEKHITWVMVRNAILWCHGFSDLPGNGRSQERARLSSVKKQT